jgi:hypothetical protein
MVKMYSSSSKGADVACGAICLNFMERHGNLQGSLNDETHKKKDIEK